MLWLWCRPAATGPIGPLAWEPPCVTGVTLEKMKEREREREREKERKRKKERKKRKEKDSELYIPPNGAEHHT